MKNKLKYIPAIAIALASYSGVAKAAPGMQVRLRPSGTAVQTVKSVYSHYLQTSPSVKIMASEITPWAGHSPQIVAKFISKSTCKQGGKRCHTVILGQSSTGRWGVMLQQSASTVAIAPHPQLAPANIILDGVHIWEPMGSRYLPSINSYISGPPMTASKAVKNPETVKILSSFFHGGKLFAEKMINVGGSLGVVDVVQPVGQDCGEVGCDLITFGNHKPVLDTIAPGIFGLAKQKYSSDGVRGIVIGTAFGLDFYRWNSTREKFQKVRTTYASRTSPSP